ncbi:tetratricopeptide repeat protein [Morganella morganii]|uniref:tetratricopeptide repeat protein n=1 Tax=Morganella morganii TaxID=582 RepID=UPI0030FEBC92
MVWKKNEAQAVTWLEKSAAQHNADAQYVLGSLYAHGSGVTEDKNKAIEFYDKAREQNHPGAQYMLGIMYLEGKYVAPNYKYARYLIGEACKGGADGACDTFSRLPPP